MSGAVHIIRRQVIDIHGQGSEDGLSVQRDVERMWEDRLQHDLSQLLDRYDTPGMTLSVGRLEIEVTDMTADDLKTGNTEKIIRKVEERLQRYLNTNAARESKIKEESFFRKWLFYLEYGHFPWWSSVTDAVVWKQQLSGFLSHPFTFVQLETLRTALEKETIRLRLQAHLDEDSFWKLTTQLLNADEQYVHLLRSDITKLSEACTDTRQKSAVAAMARSILLLYARKPDRTGKLQQLLVDGLFRVLQDLSAKTYDVSVLDNSGAIFLKKEIEEKMIRMDNNAPIKGEIKKQDTPGKPIEDSELYEEGIYVANAGIVIVAVYLPVLFDRVGLLEGKTLKDTHKCIALLHYLATGNKAAEEFECVVAKILCGLMPDDYADLTYSINDMEQELADGLLKAVISNWNKLGNTSPEGLREAFLTREGKLTLQDSNWVLEMQRETLDVLLGFLPWTISMIKLPWMDRLLQVKWE